MNPSSQKATPSADKSGAASRAPKRERGRQRVAALIDAASKVIAARGYAAATMTAIAAEAGAAIGSLYQFFPTKAALAEVLLGRYGERLGAALDALTDRAGELTPETLAEGLAAMMLDLTADRAAVMAILDARADTVGARRQLRARFEAGIERLLRVVRPDVADDDMAMMRLTLLYMLKEIPAMAGDTPQATSRLRAHAARAMALYIAS